MCTNRTTLKFVVAPSPAPPAETAVSALYARIPGILLRVFVSLFVGVPKNNQGTIQKSFFVTFLKKGNAKNFYM
jgi:hypothetical protein